MTNEEIISNFLRTEYTDERLAALLAHAEDGRLSFMSCCCVAGVPTAEHALVGAITSAEQAMSLWKHHGPTYADVPQGRAVSSAFGALAVTAGTDAERDSQRRAKLIPLIKAEMERREHERSSSIHSEIGETVGVTV